MNLISKLYDIQMECESNGGYTSNVTIDDFVIIKVKVSNFNGEPMPNTSVAVNWNKGDSTIGYSAELSDTSWYTITKETSVQTNSQGFFHLKYHASAWGLCTVLCGHSRLQFYVRGFKEIDVTSTNDCSFEVDESIRCCRLKWKYTYSGNVPFTATTVDTISLPAKYQGAAFLVPKKTYNSRIIAIIYNQTIVIKSMETYSGSMNNHYEYFEWYY